MPGKHCAYGLCRSDSRYDYRDYMRNVYFLPFPKPHSNREKCLKWLNACGRKDLSMDRITKHHYVCSKHFVGGNGPTPENPDPVSVWYSNEQIKSLNRKRRKLVRVTEIPPNNLLDSAYLSMVSAVPSCSESPTKNNEFEACQGLLMLANASTRGGDAFADVTEDVLKKSEAVVTTR